MNSLFKKRQDDLTVGEQLVIAGIVSLGAMAVTLVTFPAVCLIEYAVEEMRDKLDARKVRKYPWDQDPTEDD